MALGGEAPSMSRSVGEGLSRTLRAVEDAWRNAAEGDMRSPRLPSLIAVSKKQPAEAVLEAVKYGQLQFGENFVSELVEKAKCLPAHIQWHFIGHLQTNKVRALLRGVPNLQCISSIDSLRLAECVHREMVSLGRSDPIQVLVQVNAGGEPQKGGVVAENWQQTASASLDLVDQVVGKFRDTLRFRGFMTVAPANPEEAVIAFRRMRELANLALLRPAVAALFAEQHPIELSMGMSGDLVEAIRHGSTQVRVGSAIFGVRPSQAGASVNFISSFGFVKGEARRQRNMRRHHEDATVKLPSKPRTNKSAKIAFSQSIVKRPKAAVPGDGVANET